MAYVDPELKKLIMAMNNHGATVWGSTACGSGRAGGAAMTTSYHVELIMHLVETAARRIRRLEDDDPAVDEMTLESADEMWQLFYPGAAPLTEPPRNTLRAGPDGRPV